MKQKAKMKTFINQLLSGNIKTKQEICLKYIKDNSPISSNAMTDIITMKRELNMAHQSLTGALSVLEDCGLIKVVGEKTYKEIKNSSYSIYEFVDAEEERMLLIEQRHMDKFLMWLSNVENYQEFLPQEITSYLMNIKHKIKDLL
jgi:DNA-binding transcriptional ArsR family regulator